MRSQDSLDQSFHDSECWQSDPNTGKQGAEIDRYTLPSIERAKLSLSGKERNSAFVKSAAGRFTNVSGNSGLDSPSDGRSSCVFDMDRDGYSDYLVTNTNDRTLHIYRNQIGELKDSNNFIAVQLTGGNKENQPSTEFSSRDPAGAIIQIQCGVENQIRELRFGEGLAAQNSTTLLIGLGTSTSVDLLKVRWPSGKTSEIPNIKSGSLVRGYEDPQEPENESGFVISDYLPSPVVANTVAPPTQSLELDESLPMEKGELAVLTTMATWCGSCKGHLPEIEKLQNANNDLQVFAFPIDPKDSPEKLAEYVRENKPKYQLLPGSVSTTEKIVKLALETLGSADVPFSIVLDDQGEIKDMMQGFPTVSDIRAAKNIDD